MSHQVDISMFSKSNARHIQPTRRNWSVFGSWRFVASAGVQGLKTSFSSSIVIFVFVLLFFCRQTCLVLSSFVASVGVRGSLEKLQTTENYQKLDPALAHQPTKRSLLIPVWFRRVGWSAEGITLKLELIVHRQDIHNALIYVWRHLKV